MHDPEATTMRLYLIRHGETELNVTRVVQPADTPLSERGLAQAAALARRLGSAAIAGIVSSDLPRALQTAEQLAQTTGLQMSVTGLLQERNFGELRGLAYDQLNGGDPLRMEAAPPGGESRQQFLRRVAEAFDHVLQLQAELGGPLAVVSHGLVIHAMLLHHARLSAGQMLPTRLRNSSLSVVLAQPPYPVELLDCTAHLDDGLTDQHDSLAGA